MTKAEIQLVRALTDKRGRAEHGLFVAEGAKLIGELRASHLRVRRIYALEGVFDGPGVETVSPREMERLSLLKTPSNSLATVEIPRYRPDAERPGHRPALAPDDGPAPGHRGPTIPPADPPPTGGPRRPPGRGPSRPGGPGAAGRHPLRPWGSGRAGG